jgi:hypothetical protein
MLKRVTRVTQKLFNNIFIKKILHKYLLLKIIGTKTLGLTYENKERERERERDGIISLESQKKPYIIHLIC